MLGSKDELLALSTESVNTIANKIYLNNYSGLPLNIKLLK